MDPETLYHRLREAAESLGIEVRDCPSESDGAVVRLRGKTVVFVPAGALAARRAEVLAETVATMDTENIYLLPAVRDAIEAARKTKDEEDQQ